MTNGPLNYPLKHPFKRVAILGAGLLGGSVALAVRKALPDTQLALWARKEAPLEKAREMGIEITSTDLAEITKEADLIILATPVGVMGSLTEKILLAHPDIDALVTDVGSVKRLTHQLIEPVVKDSKLTYIGSHPMAGSEVAGIEAAKVDLLANAACIVTTDHSELADQVELLSEFWTSLACRVRFLSPEDHDYAVARISHFPHTIACIAAKVGLEYEDIASLAGGGLRDTSRVASGDPVLWSEILLENRDALQRSIAQSIEEMIHFQTLLRDNKQDEILTYLAEAKAKRDLLN